MTKTNPAPTQQGEALEPRNASGKPLFPGSITMVACDQCDEAMPWPLRCGHTYVGIHSREYRRAAVAGPRDVIELLSASLLHPESAEGYVRQAIEMLSAAATASPTPAESDATCAHCNGPITERILAGTWVHTKTGLTSCRKPSELSREIFHAAPVDNDAERLRWLLKRIIADLPKNRDWLDPDIEQEARELAKGDYE